MGSDGDLVLLTRSRPPSWAAVPLDPGTARVLRDGCRILHDPEGLLGHALEAVQHPAESVESD
jgi:hypothetical protein